MEYILSILLFITIYFQVFLLWSFFEKKYEKEKRINLKDTDYLSTTIIVPCFNEEKTVERTVKSLLNLDYPKEKLKVIIVDDGSTDNTWKIIQQFSVDNRIKLLKKKNEGSKFAALNFALKYIDTDLVGVLDSDSWVSRSALREYMYFFKDKDVLATIPSMLIAEPDSLLRKAQKAEYDVGIFSRKAFANINSIYIAPGPFSVFRKYVFDTLGPYKEAHHTEDAEIALRMQRHHYKIAYSEKSIVYTVGPKTFRLLIKQRVRWVYGFIKNVIDYKGLFFKKEYKDLGFIVLPIGIFRTFISVIVFPISLFLIFLPLFKFIKNIFIVGYHPGFNFDLNWFYLDLSVLQVITTIAFIITIFTVWMGRNLYGENKKYTIDILYMFVLYTFIAPLWLIKSVWNVLLSKKESWR